MFVRNLGRPRPDNGSLNWRHLRLTANSVICVPQLFTCFLNPSNRVSNCKYLYVSIICENTIARYSTMPNFYINTQHTFI